MSISDPSRFDELLSRYLDGSLEGAEEHELLHYLSDESFALRFHELTRLDTEIAGLLAGSIRDEVMVELVWSDLGRSEAASSLVEAEPPAAVPAPIVARWKPKKRTGLVLALAAALICMLGVAALHFFHGPAPAAPAKIVSVRGEVYFISPSGQRSLRDGQSMEDDGTIKTVGPDSRATLALGDGTRIALLGNTSLCAGMASGKRRLFLEAGILRSTVARQPENTPLVFGTAEATATVRGTELAIIEENSETYLIVLHGAVALRRSSDGFETLINAGYYGHVEQDGEFHPWPVARLPKALRDRIENQN